MENPWKILGTTKKPDYLEGVPKRSLEQSVQISTPTEVEAYSSLEYMISRMAVALWNDKSMPETSPQQNGSIDQAVHLDITFGSMRTDGLPIVSPGNQPWLVESITNGT